MLRFALTMFAAAILGMAIALPSPAQGTDEGAAPARKQPRQLAPGVLTVIPPNSTPGETFSGPRPMLEIVVGMPELNVKPNTPPKTDTVYERATKVIYRQKVWQLEFAFKPLRMIEVDLPQPSGKMIRKKVWYLMYRVRNLGSHLTPVAKKDENGRKIYTLKQEDRDVTFIPLFALEGHKIKKAYLDRLIPLAKEAINQREDPSIKLHDSVTISQKPIPVSTARENHPVWGVAMWSDVDPRLDRFSIYVQGLSNAFRWEDPPGAYRKGDPPGTGRRYIQKTLKLNFWRPGDMYLEHEEEFRYGIPGEVDYEWVYR